MMISRKASNIFPPNRLVRKVFLIVCFLWENFIELRIRIDREWTCFKGAKWFVLITSGKLWSLPSRKPIGSKSVFVDVLCKGNHIDLRIRTDREWAWFEDSKQFAMITSRKPWNNFPPKRMGYKLFWLLMQLSKGNIRSIIDKLRICNGGTWLMFRFYFDEARPLIQTQSFRDSQTVHPKENWIKRNWM